MLKLILSQFVIKFFHLISSIDTKFESIRFESIFKSMIQAHRTLENDSSVLNYIISSSWRNSSMGRFGVGFENMHSLFVVEIDSKCIRGCRPVLKYSIALDVENALAKIMV